MKYAVMSLAIGFTLIANESFADLGLGVSVESNSRYLYVPVKVSTEFMVEPFFSYSDGNVDNGLITQKVQSTEIGSGFFYMNRRSEKSEIYFGGRLGYSSGETSYPGDRKDEFNGYAVSPTIGFQYEILPKLYLAGEEEWIYTKYDSKHDQDGSTFKGNIKENTTNARVLIRYFF